MESFLDNLRLGLNDFFGDNRFFKIVVVLLLTVLLAYFLSKILAKMIVKITQMIAVQSDEASSEERFIQLRRVETYLSVAIAIVRFLIVILAVFLAIEFLADGSFTPAAAIGASTIFFVLGAAILGPLLRDITVGAVMIIEKWYSVGDFIRVEPFLYVRGVVERVTLRSTKIRDISGEVIWMHNQHVQAVAVTPNGKRTQAVDLFVDNVEQAKKEIEQLIKTLRPSPTMLASPLHIVETEQLNGELWRITIVGETAPGREWMIDDFFVQTLKEADRRNRHFSIVYGPLVRYADEAAERRFRRAVRVSR